MKSNLMDSDDVRTIIDRMAAGDTEAILTGIESKTSVVNLNAIIFGAKYKIKEKEFIDALSSRFIDSEISFMGNKISQFAEAALDVLGVKKYNGNDHFVIELINSDFEI